MRTATTNRANLTKKIAINNITNQEASEVLEKTLEEIAKALAGGEDVKIASFGTFGIIHKKSGLAAIPARGKMQRFHLGESLVFGLVRFLRSRLRTCLTKFESNNSLLVLS